MTGGEGYSGDGKEDVRRCRQAAEEAQKEAEKAVEEHMKAISDQDIDIRKQQEEIEKNMRDLEAQVGSPGGVGRVGDGSGRVLVALALVFSFWMARLVSL